MAKDVLSAPDIAGKILDVVDGDIRAWDHPLTTYSIDVPPDLTFIETWAGIGIILWDQAGPGDPYPHIVPLAEPAKTAMTAKVEEAFELWDDVIAHNMVKNDSGSAHITFNFIDNVPAGSGGYTRSAADSIWMPWPFDNIGDNKLNQADIYVPTTADTSYSATNAFSTAVHEIGHALGLRHPGDYDASKGPANYERDATFAQDTRQYTVMSYFDAKDAIPGATKAADDLVRPQTPMVYDILAVQSIPGYGVDTTTRTGNTTYGFFTATSDLDRQVFNFDVNTRPYLTIWDAGGTDTLNVSKYTEDQFIDLNPGAYSDIGKWKGNVGIAFGTWIENAVGGSGADKIYGNAASNSLTGNDGLDRMYGGAASDFLYGGKGDDQLFGGTEVDFLFGEDDNDTLNGEAGADQMFGGMGNDIYCVDDYGDQVIDVAAADGGLDKVYTTLSYFDLRAARTGDGWVEELQYTGDGEFTGHGSAGVNTIVGAGQHDELYGYESGDFLFGGGGDDTLDGGSGADWLYGEDDNDTLYGGSDDDMLIGGRGADDMWGGSGRDTYYVDDQGDVVHELLYLGTPSKPAADQTDKVISFISYQLPKNVENLDLEGFLSDWGKGNDLNNVINGSMFDNDLFGYAGSDTLDGRGGADWMDGGRGNDIYYVDDLGDRTIELRYVDVADYNQRDTVYASVDNYRLEDNVEQLFLQGAAISGYGNKLNNLLIGTDAANVLDAGDGADILIGGAGADKMYGGTGNDTYYVDDRNDQIFEWNGYSPTTRKMHLSGTDLVYSDASDYALGSEVENLTLSAHGKNGYGNELANIIVGNDLANRLSGEGGNDTLTGGKGVDTFLYGSNWGKDVITDFKVSEDRLDLKGISGVTSFSQLKIVDTAKGAVITVGSDTTNSITLTGVTKAKLIEFSAYSFDFGVTKYAKAAPGQVIDGTKIWGGTATGGSGNDTATFLGVDGMLNVDLQRDGGLAELESGAKIGTSTHLTSIENITGAKNFLNWLYGDAKDNILVGGDVGDWLEGRGGNNIIDGGGGSDYANYLLSGGSVEIDLTLGKVTHATGVDTVVNVENFIGTNLADTFIGDAQANYFQGYNDNDVMRGGAGNDTLEGGGGIDQLFGGADDDRLAGGFDDDTLTGELGADAFVFRSIANGQDRITDFHIDQGDYIDFSEHATVNSMTDLTITTEGGNAVIHYGADSITLDGVQALDIRADWFHF